jgi:hypothetical protein
MGWLGLKRISPVAEELTQPVAQSLLTRAQLLARDTQCGRSVALRARV